MVVTLGLPVLVSLALSSSSFLVDCARSSSVVLVSATGLAVVVGLDDENDSKGNTFPTMFCTAFPMNDDPVGRAGIESFALRCSL